MCNLSEGIEKRGEARGVAIGEARGEARGVAIGEARGIARGRAEALAEKKRAILDIALNLLKKGFPISLVTESTHLTTEEVQKLAKDNGLAT